MLIKLSMCYLHAIKKQDSMIDGGEGKEGKFGVFTSLAWLISSMGSTTSLSLVTVTNRVSSFRFSETLNSGWCTNDVSCNLRWRRPARNANLP